MDINVTLTLDDTVDLLSSVILVERECRLELDKSIERDNRGSEEFWRYRLDRLQRLHARLMAAL